MNEGGRREREGRRMKEGGREGGWTQLLPAHGWPISGLTTTQSQWPQAAVFSCQLTL